MKLNHVMESANRSLANITLASGDQIELYVEATVALDDRADHWLFLMLPVSMMLGEDLEISGKLSHSAIAAFDKAQAEILRGHPKMSPIKLKFDQSFDDSLPKLGDQRKVGLFFSGGLDSTYASETISDIDSLVLIWGFDIPAKNQKHWDLSLEFLEPYAKDIGRDLVVVKTNIRELSNGILQWGGDYHGTALSGVATALSPELRKMYVAAGFVRTEPVWGHSATLYSCYNTDSQEIEETDPVKRIAKAAAIGDNPRTTKVRACYRNITGLANCGACKKCVRTRLEFELVKAQYRPLGLETTPKAIEILRNKLTYWDYLFYLEALGWARQNGFKGTLGPLIVVTATRVKSIFQIYFEKVLTRLGVEKPKKVKKRPKAKKKF